MKFYLIIFLILFTSCSRKDNFKNPNNASEMAILMRDMQFQLKDLQNEILNGNNISDIRLNFDFIHEKKPTDSSFLVQNLTFMSKAFNESVESFNEDPSTERYKNIVSQCISCHQNLCPGPLNAIIKLNKINSQ
tara:strand:- start:568 stop:969 length:402 start_codon:yes stop_codon:yes gene_type:complete